MPATPTTKSQVQAYRFVLKRMESALVRRDAVMLHDPMRTHLRASIVGLALALLLALGFLVFGFIKPRQALGDADEILLVKQSGQVFVHVNNPSKRLIPVDNLASARLILIKQASNGGGSGDAALARPRQVDESVIKDVPREPRAGIVAAPGDVPAAGNLIDPRWSVCDTTVQDERLPDSSRIERPSLSTAALAGVPGPGTQLAADQALLVRASTGDYYLVYDDRRAKIDVSNFAIRSAFRLAVGPGELMRDERPVSDGLLNAIPEEPELVSPVTALGDRSKYAQLGALRVGEVFRVNRVANVVEYFLIRENGIQAVSQSVAELVRYTVSREKEIPAIEPESTNGVDVLDSTPDIENFPEAVPTIVPVADSRVTCLNWSVGAQNEQQQTITIGPELTLPSGQRPVSLASADTQTLGLQGQALDEFFMPTGRGAAVQGVVPEQVFGTGTIFLVSDQGVKYGVPNWSGGSAAQLAAGLGMTKISPAPEAVLRLLPIGPALDPDLAIRTFDAAPAIGGGEGDGGVLPQPSGSPFPGGGG